MLMAKALFSSEKLHAIIKLTRVRLARACGIVVAQLRRWEVEMVEPSAGVFIWARLLRQRETEIGMQEIRGESKNDGSGGWEMQQIEQLRGNGVLISPGQQYHLAAWPQKNGWVRITFAVEEDQLREGLRRIGVTLGLGEMKEVFGRHLEEEKGKSSKRSVKRDTSAVNEEARRPYTP